MSRPSAASGAGGRLMLRLLVVEALVVIAGALTLVIVALVIAPGLFRDHLHRAVGPVEPLLAGHLNRALAEALGVSLTVAVTAAVLTALAVSWLVTRRLTAPVTAMAAAATQVADGHYQTRVPPSRLGVEFAALDNAFNRMATTLERTDRRRRELLADLGHELRTPVATLDSFLEGIEDGVIPSTPDTWRTMRDQTARLRRLLDDVDTVSHAEERHLHPRPVDLDDAVDQAVRATTASFTAAGVSLTHHRAAGATTVQADPDRLREIFDNLLGNALRHTPAGGRVTLTTTVAPGRVTVVVADTGEGLAAEHLPHVFDRFYRADRARARATGGSGIGLTIARALARAHHGDLTAASRGPGHGASFTLTLPAAAATVGDPTRRRDRHPTPR